MLTFDRALIDNDANSELKAILKGGEPVPDLIECGENNEVWIKVRRSTKNLEFVDKVNGKVLKKLALADIRTPSLYGLTIQQLGAARAALELKASDGTI